MGLATAPDEGTLEVAGIVPGGPYADGVSGLANAREPGQGAPAQAFAGAAVTETVAAAVYGAPVVSRADGPLDCYVPSPMEVARVSRRCGEASLLSRAGAVAVAPVSLAVRLRRPPRPGSRGLPLAHPLVVALDLAQDAARGHEILEGFDPEGVTRVWG